MEKREIVVHIPGLKDGLKSIGENIVIAAIVIGLFWRGCGG